MGLSARHQPLIAFPEVGVVDRRRYGSPREPISRSLATAGDMTSAGQFAAVVSEQFRGLPTSN